MEPSVLTLGVRLDCCTLPQHGAMEIKFIPSCVLWRSLEPHLKLNVRLRLSARRKRSRSSSALGCRRRTRSLSRTLASRRPSRRRPGWVALRRARAMAVRPSAKWGRELPLILRGQKREVGERALGRVRRGFTGRRSRAVPRTTSLRAAGAAAAADGGGSSILASVAFYLRTTPNSAPKNGCASVTLEKTKRKQNKQKQKQKKQKQNTNAFWVRERKARCQITYEGERAWRDWLRPGDATTT